MKNKAFTLIELFVVMMILAILAGIMVPTIQKANQKYKQIHQTERGQSSDTHQFNTGDMVYIDGMNINGKVNEVYDNNRADLLLVGTNGVPTVMERVDIQLLKRIPSADWKR